MLTIAGDMLLALLVLFLIACLVEHHAQRATEERLQFKTGEIAFDRFGRRIR